MNSERHGRARTGTFSALLIIKRTPFGPRISNLVGNHEPAGHTDDLGSVIVSDELRTLTLRTQSSRYRTRSTSAPSIFGTGFTETYGVFTGPRILLTTPTLRSL